MSVKHFTREQVEELQKNPYVVSVTERYINYTEEFKVLFLADYESGLTPSVIFQKYGIDPQVLGAKRRSAFIQRVKNESKRLSGFKDTRKGNSGRPRTKDLTPEEEIARLKHKNKLLQQENDFLKRIRSINKKQLSKIQKDKQQEKNTN